MRIRKLNPFQRLQNYSFHHEIHDGKLRAAGNEVDRIPI